MTRIVRHFVRQLAVLGALVGACGDGGGRVDADVAVARIDVTPPTDTLAPGEDARLEARAHDAAGGDLRGARVVWSTSSAEVATVDAAGRVRAVGPGLAVIAAVAGGARGEARVVVRRRPATLALEPDSIRLGELVIVRPVVRDAEGVVLPYTLTLASRDSAVLRVDGPIAVTGRAVGTATVAVTVEGRVLTAPLRVTPPRVASVSFRIDDWIVPVGTSRPLSVSVLVGGLRTNAIDWPVAWRSTNPAAVSVDARGVVTGVAPGDAYVIATSGGVEGWTHVRAATFDERLTFTGVAVGEQQSCALSAGGTAYCWGDNGADRLGVVGPTERLHSGDRWLPVTSAPLPVRSPVRFATLASGNAARGGCALTAAGEPYCWGGSADGALPVPGGVRFAALSRGDQHACGVSADGRAYCWGYNNVGQLGIGTRDFTFEDWRLTRTPPQPVAGDLRFASISAGPGNTCGITLDGDLYCWGEGVLVPTRTGGALKYRSVTTSARVCAISTAGETYCWPDVLSPTNLAAVRVAAPELVVAVGGARSGCGLDRAGTTYCFSFGGQPIDATQPPAGPAQPLAGVPPLRTIALSGGYAMHACGLTAAGVAHCWGWSHYGQAGVGPADAPALPPVKVAGQP
jgi:hypothetical protein